MCSLVLLRFAVHWPAPKKTRPMDPSWTGFSFPEACCVFVSLRCLTKGPQDCIEALRKTVKLAKCVFCGAVVEGGTRQSYVFNAPAPLTAAEPMTPKVGNCRVQGGRVRGCLTLMSLPQGPGRIAGLVCVFKKPVLLVWSFSAPAMW